MVNPLNINVESQRVIMEYIVDAQNICTNLLDTIYQYFLVLDLSFLLPTVPIFLYVLKQIYTSLILFSYFMVAIR